MNLTLTIQNTSHVEIVREDAERRAAGATVVHTGLWSPTRPKRSIEAAARRAVIERAEALDILSR